MTNTTVNFKQKENASFGAFEGDTSGLNAEQILAKLNEQQQNEQKVKEENSEDKGNSEDNEENVNTVNFDIYAVVVDFIDEKFKDEENKGQLFLEYVKELEEKNLAIQKEKEELEVSVFIKEKAITKDIFEALNGETLKEKEESLKKIKKINNFTLNTTKNNKKTEIKLQKRF